MPLPRPVDLDHLARYTGGDRAVNADVLGLFASQSSELLSKLDTALKNNDSKAWRDITHSLKGGARGIGAFALADAAQLAEAASPEADTNAAARALHDLKSQSLAVSLFIDAYLDR